jgi:hypothetical protein
VTNPIEMGSSFERVVAALNADPTYVADFRVQYTDEITEANIVDAIAEYEAVLAMGRHQFGRNLDAEQVRLLGALTGKLPGLAERRVVGRNLRQRLDRPDAQFSVAMAEAPSSPGQIQRLRPSGATSYRYS